MMKMTGKRLRRRRRRRRRRGRRVFNEQMIYLMGRLIRRWMNEVNEWIDRWNKRWRKKGSIQINKWINGEKIKEKLNHWIDEQKIQNAARECSKIIFARIVMPCSLHLWHFSFLRREGFEPRSVWWQAGQLLHSGTCTCLLTTRPRRSLPPSTLQINKLETI